jgi:hypothetical protein
MAEREGRREKQKGFLTQIYEEVLWWVLPTLPGFHIIVLINAILYFGRKVKSLTDKEIIPLKKAGITGRV